MKISEEFLNKNIGGIEFEDHEMVPFFVVTEDSIFVDGEVSKNVVENFYTTLIDDIIYVKMDSDHKNPDGTFDGAEPTAGYGKMTGYSLERQRLWAEQFGTAYSANAMMEIRKVAGMDTIEYREYKRAQLEAESKPGSFAFDCEVSGVTYSFNIDDSDRIDVIGQLAMGATEVEIHDIHRAHEGTYSATEAGLIMVTLATVTRQYKYPYDERIKALYNLPSNFTKEDVDAI